MSSTDVARPAGLDLTQAPWQQWDAGMVKLAKQTVLRDAKDDSEVYFCLALADSLGLNPFANEVYFIRRKARDGDTGGVVPYIGREGLLKKAAEHGAHFEADTVRERDEFVVLRDGGGARTVHHRYGQEAERGAIVGAWALLHSRDESPAFFYASLSEYLPHFDADWKLAKSPWGNQRSAMIEKCAMIGAARQRINLAGVLMDAEVGRVQQQAVEGEAVAEEAEFDWDQLRTDGGLAPVELRDRLRAAVGRVNELVPLSWSPAKVEMVAQGRPVDELAALCARVEGEAEVLAARRADRSATGPAGGREVDGASAPDVPVEALSGAEVEPSDAEVVDSVAALEETKRVLEGQLREPGCSEEDRLEIQNELDGIDREITMARNSDQGRMDV